MSIHEPHLQGTLAVEDELRIEIAKHLFRGELCGNVEEALRKS